MSVEIGSETKEGWLARFRGRIRRIKDVPEYEPPLPRGQTDVSTLNRDRGPIFLALSWLNGDLDGKGLHEPYVMGQKNVLMGMTAQIAGHSGVEGATILQAEVIKNDYLEEADQVLARVKLENVKHRVVTSAVGIELVATTIAGFKHEIFDSLPSFATLVTNSIPVGDRALYLATKVVNYVTGTTIPIEKVLSGWFEVAKANNILLRAIPEMNPVEFSAIVIGLLGLTYAFLHNEFNGYIDSKQSESLNKMSMALFKFGSIRDNVLGIKRPSLRERTLEELFYEEMTKE